MNRWLVLLLLVLLQFASSCEKEDATKPDTTPPSVAIISPITGAEVFESVAIQVNASDNDLVEKVEFHIDDQYIAEADDETEPYEYVWDVSSLDAGTNHTIFARAFDVSGNSANSTTIAVIIATIPPDWTLLVEDEDDTASLDISEVLVKNGDETLDFRIQMNGGWQDPHDWQSGLNCAIFLDVDQNTSTGLSVDDDVWYAVNDIGPDYALFIGWEGDSLYAWNDHSDVWVAVSYLDDLSLEHDDNHFEVSVSLADIGDPASIDIVAANIDASHQAVNNDWAPNVGMGHATWDVINGLRTESELIINQKTLQRRINDFRIFSWKTPCRGTTQESMKK